MYISVAICTWNRCEMLGRTLEQMTRLVIPAGVEWELLVINNACTDATDHVAAAFADRLPLRLLHQPTPGKSHALNLAADQARGEYILWTDDDVLVSEGWIAAYHDAFVQWPDAAVFGGTIEPWFDGNPPVWLEQILPRVGNAYAIRSLGAEAIPLESPEVMPFGANMAVRTVDQRRFRYDPDIGPRPGSGLRGEETQLVNQMLGAGLQGWWVPQARVRHWIPKHRQTTQHLRDYYGGWGEYLVWSDPVHTHDGVLLFGQPRWVWRGIIEGEVKFQVRRLLRQRPEVWIDDLISASIARGQRRAYAALPVPATIIQAASV